MIGHIGGGGTRVFARAPRPRLGGSRSPCWFAACCSLFACCSPGGAPSLSCERQPIVFGSVEPDSIELSEPQRNAIAVIAYAGGDLCTGTFATADSVATAAHCVLRGRGPTILVGPSERDPIQLLSPGEGERHPELDLGVFRLSRDDIRADVTPIPLIRSSVALLVPGDIVEIAGFGINEAGRVGVRRFAPSTVQEIDETSVVVSADGESGACSGDSGGPILGQDSDGQPLVLGILTAGHPSCLAQDRYQRTDVATEFWDEHAPIARTEICH